MTLADAIKMRQEQSSPVSRNINVILHMPEVASMVRHLDMLYTRLISDRASGQSQEGNNLVEILGKPYIQTASWYNTGDSRVREG